VVTKYIDAVHLYGEFDYNMEQLSLFFYKTSMYFLYIFVILLICHDFIFAWY